MGERGSMDIKRAEAANERDHTLTMRDQSWKGWRRQLSLSRSALPADTLPLRDEFQKKSHHCHLPNADLPGLDKLGSRRVVNWAMQEVAFEPAGRV